MAIYNLLGDKSSHRDVLRIQKWLLTTCEVTGMAVDNLLCARSGHGQLVKSQEWL